MQEQFNNPGRLPPVDTWLIINVNGVQMRAKRTGYIASRNDALEYELTDGSTISGRFEWIYP